MAIHSYRDDLVARLEAEAKAATQFLAGEFDDPQATVIAMGILHLARLCNEAAEELKRSNATLDEGEKHGT